MSLRDADELLGLSHQRQQLVQAQWQPLTSVPIWQMCGAVARVGEGETAFIPPN